MMVAQLGATICIFFYSLLVRSVGVGTNRCRDSDRVGFQSFAPSTVGGLLSNSNINVIPLEPYLSDSIT
jgi:hypothetical protein